MTITRRLSSLRLGQVYFRQLKSLLETDDFAVRVGRAFNDIELQFGQIFAEEVGTWTPVIGGSTSTSGQTYTAQVGRYFRFGTLIIAPFTVVLSNAGTITGDVQIQGLPYACNPDINGDFELGHWSALNTAVICVPGSIAVGTTAIRLFLVTGAATSSIAAFMQPADVTNTTRFAGVAIYEAA